MKKLLYTIAFICSSASLFAQDFALTYEPTSDEGFVTIRDLATVSDGNLIVGYDYVNAGVPVSGIMKTAADGSILWSKTLLVPESVAGCSFEVLENAEGNFYLWGLSKAATSNKSAILSEISADGEMLWSKNYDFGTHPSAAYSINSLDILPSGNLQMMIAVYENVIVIQTNANGEIIWGKVSAMGPPDDEGGKNPGFEWLAIPDDGGMCASKAGNDFSLLRYSDEGELLWNRAYKLGGYTHCKTLVTAPNGNVLIAGYIDYVPHIMEVSAEDGEMIWIKTFEGLSMLFTGKSHLTVDGDNIYLDFTTTTNQQYVLRMSETGEVLETMMTKNNVLDYNKIELIDQDEVYLYGSSLEGDTYKGMILRTDDLFVESCMVGPAEAVTTVDFVTYTEVDFTPTEWDFADEADIEIGMVDLQLRAKFACEVVLSDGPDAAISNVVVYPNPTANNITIQVTEDLVNALFIMTDLSGKQVMNSTITSLQSEIDLSGLNNGQYILSIQTENGLKTQKITVLK
ncbi:MAG: T9SS type A sorting domain-containing protein [Crocinitomix sp.]|nr:T9SS type A sorting domain-containing protein [Crocinitomix sp.]